MTGWTLRMRRWGHHMRGLREVSHSGVWDRKIHAWAEKFCLRVLQLGWQSSCGDNELRESCMYVCIWPFQQYSPRYPITLAVYWSDISGNFHWCGTGAPAVKTEQQGGFGWGEMSRGEREREREWELDVAYQTWQDLAALWLMGENTDKFSLFLSVSVSVPYCFRR